MRYEFLRRKHKGFDPGLIDDGSLSIVELSLRVYNIVQATQNYLSTESLAVGTCAKSTLICFLI